MTCEGHYGETLSVEVYALGWNDALEQCLAWGYTPRPASAKLIRTVGRYQRRLLKRTRTHTREAVCE